MTSGKWFKAGCIVLYAVILGLFYLSVHDRTMPHSKATRPIQQHEQIASKDIVSIDHDTIVNRFATREIKEGATITEKHLSPIGIVPPAQPLLAVAANIARPASGNDPGSADFQICLDDKPIGKIARPLTTKCNAKTCLVVLPLDDGKEFATAAPGKRVHVVASGQGCDGG